LHIAPAWWIPFSKRALSLILQGFQKPKWLFVGLLLLFAPGLFLLKANDHLFQLQAPSAKQLQTDAQMRQQFSLPDLSQFVLVHHSDFQKALLEQELWQSHLDSLTQKHSGYSHSLSQWIPSCQKQQKQWSDFKNWWTYYAHQQMPLWGYQKSIIDQLDSSVNTPFTCVDLTQLQKFPKIQELFDLNLVFTPQKNHHSSKSAEWFMLSLTQGIGSFVSENTPHEPKQSAWIHQQKELTLQMQNLRIQSIYLTLIAYILIFIGLIYQLGLQKSVRIFVPVFLGTLVVLGCLGYMQNAVNFFSMMALILVLGIGIDYTLFMSDLNPQENQISDNFALNWFASLVAALTTIGAFGTLILSSTPALKTFGWVILIGLLAFTLLSPFAGVSWKSKK
jgi:predicted exporter